MTIWTDLQETGWTLGGGEGGHWGMVERGGARAMILESPAGGYAWAVSRGDETLGDGYCEQLDEAAAAAVRTLDGSTAP